MVVAQATYAEQVHSILGPLIPEGAPLAVFDFPNHSNVGDSAIWLGEVEYLRSRHPRSRVVWTSDTSLGAYVLPSLTYDTVVLIHGGGNIGDLWPACQANRERLIRHYRQHRVIQLPQSIHFQETRNLSACREAFAGHPDFHLLVRDTASLHIAESLHQGAIYLCPDMALCIGRLPRKTAPTHDIVALLRTDKEGILPPQSSGMLADVCIIDWLDEPATLTQKLDRLLTRYPNRSRRVRRHIYQHLARERVNRGSAILESGRVVITDRLHGHILCTLLRIPHVVLDNSYRKIGNFSDTWHTGAELSQSATTFEEAVTIARRVITALSAHQGA